MKRFTGSNENNPREHRCGFVALIGRPNVGKSSLMNLFLREKVGIVSAVPQTTRHQIRGVVHLDKERAQIVMVDTPGIHSFRDPLVAHLNTVAHHSLEGCDLALYVADANRRVGREETNVLKFLAAQSLPVIMVLNKIDLSEKYVEEYLEAWRKFAGEDSFRSRLKYVIPFSAKTGFHFGELKSAIVECLPVHPPFYGPEAKTDFPLPLRLAEVLREKLLMLLSQEIPHALAVLIEDIREEDRLVRVRATIYVRTASQKKIVVGKNGHVLKTAGGQARKEMAEIVGKKVFLSTWVKVLKEWPEKIRILRQLGYWWM
ncbi:MAG: GTPase Era [Candidatus Omnitrophica bacterium]|nr:GTPase Era [Candidatus Omnitrophota bacterium]